ncbi:MAG: serine/threonine-protein kinase [Planctomycetota bacterium]
MAADANAPDARPGGRFDVDFEGARLLGTYRVERRIATGGMGSVYLARDENLDRPAVVKVPHVRLLGEPGFRERFAREITELVRLEHPHIVRILAQGVHDEVPFFVLQYLSGSSLGSRLEAALDGREPASKLSTWLPTVARTLDFIHARGTVHRDVKPDNILFDEIGNVYLSDFGVAKAMGAGSVELTDLGTGIGSPQYMAPEQAMGHGVTGQADQYALATTVYRALTGRLPYEGATVVELLMAKQGKEVTPFDSAAGVPTPLWPILVRALARDPNDRFPSCMAFADAVQAAIAPPGPGTWPTVTTPPLPQTKRAAGMAALAGAVAVAGLVAWSPWSSPAAPTTPLVAPPVAGPPATPPATPEPRPSSTLVIMDTGSAPRRLLAYSVPVGFRQEWIYDARQTLQPAESEKRSAEPLSIDMRMRGVFEVKGVEPDGRMRCVFRQRPITSRSKNEYVRTLLQRQQESPGSRELVDRDFEFLLARDGEVELTPPGHEALGKLRPAVVSAIRSVIPQLPTVPVGAGASWIVTSSIHMSGTEIQYAGTNRVEALEGDLLDLYVEFGGQREGADDAEAPATVGRVSGKGSMTLDLTQLAPVDLDLTIEQESLMRRPDGRRTPVQITFEQWTPTDEELENPDAEPMRQRPIPRRRVRPRNR